MGFPMAYDVALRTLTNTHLVVAILNIDTLTMTLFDLHCTCITSFDGSTDCVLHCHRDRKYFPKIYDVSISM